MDGRFATTLLQAAEQKKQPIKIKNLPSEEVAIHWSLHLMFPLRAGFGTLWIRLPGGRQASSLSPLNMNMFCK